MFEPTDSRLGRHVNHDPRALNYPVGVLPKSAIQTVHWARRAPILDQGQLGSCTANAGTGFLGTDSAAGPGATSVTISAAGAAASKKLFKAGTYVLDESFAVLLYELTTRIDPYPGQYKPTDTGSDGPSVAAALKLLGLAADYSHVFSYAAAQAGSQLGGMLWGTAWLQSMFTPDANGFLVVDPASGVAGGHELVISGYNASTDVWTVDNSWGTSWGINGSCFVHGKDMAYLLSQQGDITIPNYAIVPAPPVPPTPAPGAATAQQLWDGQKAVAVGLGVTV
jgi:hypothetical protein